MRLISNFVIACELTLILFLFVIITLKFLVCDLYFDHSYMIFFFFLCEFMFALVCGGFEIHLKENSRRSDLLHVEIFIFLV